MPVRTIQLAWPAAYVLNAPAQPRRLTILLHGYQQSGEILNAALGDCFAPDDIVLAPDGPFPSPALSAQGRRFLGFAWYFFDPARNEYLVSMDQALDFLAALVESLGFANLPTRVVGFSQGGYLAPHLGLRLPATTQVIGVNCRFRDEALRAPLPFRLDAVHGARDNMVDPERARGCHAAILAGGGAGEFVSLPETAHRIDAAVRAAVKRLAGQFA